MLLLLLKIYTRSDLSFNKKKIGRSMQEICDYKVKIVTCMWMVDISF